MKITDVETLVLQAEIDRPTWSATALRIHPSARAASVRTVLLVRVLTSEGIVGIGQAAAGPGAIAPVRAALERVIRPYLVGQDPFFVEGIWDKAYQGTLQQGRKGVVISALSGADVALWDIIGKATGQPVYKLLGASRDTVLGYASGGWYAEGKTVADLAAEMAGYAALGFRAVKMKIGGESVKQDLERVRTAREALGPDVRLMVDANRIYDPKTAIRVARHLEELDVDWLEEPVNPDDIEGSAMVAAGTTVPVAGYETEYTTRGFRELITRRAVDIVQPDVVWSGGFTECRKIASMAHTWGMPVRPHSFGSALSMLANLHFVGSIPNGLMLEMDRTGNPFVTDLLAEPLEIDAEGYVAIPSGPGLGIALNDETVRRYRVDR